MARRDARHGPHSSFPGRTAVHQGHMHITHYTRSPWHGTPGMARTVPFRGVLRCIRATCTSRTTLGAHGTGRPAWPAQSLSGAYCGASGPHAHIEVASHAIAHVLRFRIVPATATAANTRMCIIICRLAAIATMLVLQF